MIVKTDCFILNSRKYGDSSKIISVFSEDYGKISLMAKGARTMKNKFGASLEPMSFSSITFYHKPGPELYLLSNSELCKNYSKLTSNQDYLFIGLMILETVSNTQESNHQNIELFNLLKVCFDNLLTFSKEPFCVFTYFMNKAAEILGFELDLSRINNPDDDTVCISLSDGSIKNISYGNTKSVYFLNLKEFDYFYTIVNDYDNLTIDFDIDKKSKLHIYDFFVNYFSFHLERKFYLKSAVMM